MPKVGDRIWWRYTNICNPRDFTHAEVLGVIPFQHSFILELHCFSGGVYFDRHAPLESEIEYALEEKKS